MARVKPRVSREALAVAVQRLRGCQFYSDALNPVVLDELGQICEDEDKLEFLVDRMIRVEGKFESVKQLRGVYANFWTPLDGIDAWCESGPHSAQANEQRYIEQHQERKFLPPGTNDAHLGKLLAEATRKKKLT